MSRLSRKQPLVSVIIPTYNWSSVLRYAVSSALAQTLRDFEVIVVGDGCTDDSERVVASFRSRRLGWCNLPENTGGQATPNNTGLAMARGKYAAYLSHDDLWMPYHLERLVDAITSSGADVAYSLCVMVAPPGSAVRVLTGVSESGQYEPGLLVPPTSFLHRREMAEQVGGWRDHRTLNMPVDLAFLSAAWAAGKTFTQVREVTAFKFPAPWRRDVYKTRPSFEQEQYSRRMQVERDFLSREMTAVALAYAEGRPKSPVSFPAETPGAPPGALIDQWREAKGLPPAGGYRSPMPLYADPGALRLWNKRVDILPRRGIEALCESNTLPVNGIFLGRGWYDLEYCEAGPFRWLNREGEIVLTGLDGRPKRLIVDAESGPGMECMPFQLELRGDDGGLIGTAVVSYRHEIFFAMPAVDTEGMCLRLVSPASGKPAGTDSRILNLRVFQLRLEEDVSVRPAPVPFPKVTPRAFRRIAEVDTPSDEERP